MMMAGDLYLRDLTDALQKSFIDGWKANRRYALLKAYEAGKDIAIGEYYRDADCAVI